MSSEILEEILSRIKNIEGRIDKLENKNTKTTIPQPQKPAIPKQKEFPFPIQEPVKKESHFLGFIGAGCILLASILLIKLSIDSGWLTPIRQCILAVIFSFGLIAFPFLINLKDKNYLSLLPAIGISSLHLTTYGAVFYHALINPTLGILSISLISLLSLWLLSKLQSEAYAVLAIFGTYLGAFFFHQSFSQLSQMVIYLLAWNMAFTLFSIKLKRRVIIVISSYLALGLVSFIGAFKGFNDPDFNTKILIIQIIQFCIFSIGTVLYSIKNKVKLTGNEAWAFFPVIIFFYGQEYFFIHRVSELGATIFSIIFACFLLLIYSLAKKKLGNDQLHSAGVTYTSCSIIFAHSIFMVEMNDLFRSFFCFTLILAIGFFHKKIIGNKSLKGPSIIAGVIVLYSYLSILFGSGDLSFNSLLSFGFLFGAVFLYSSQFLSVSKSNFILYLGHAQVFVSLFRLKAVIGYFAIAPLWIAYAFGILFWAYRKQDKSMASGAIPLVIIGLLRFLVFDFVKLGGGQQVLSLLVMGILIFAGGYLYRKVART